MILSIFLHNGVENDLNMIVFCDMLMILQSTVFSQKSFRVELLFELMNLLLRKSFEHLKKLLSDKFRPIESEFLIIFFDVSQISYKNGNIFTGKKPT